MKKFTKIISSILLIIIVFSLLTGISYYLYVTKEISLSEENLGYKDSTVNIYSLNNELISKSEYTDSYVNYELIPKNLSEAFVAIEDKRFYKHKGIDIIRIFGAMLNNIKSKNLSEGASTITQQLIKNTHLTAEKSLKRKTQEISLALELEKKYSKQEILEMYLNVIYFGNGIYGVQNASERFFNKDCISLSLSECAMLAGIVKNPSKYSPVINYENSIQRRNLVLNYMEEQDMINSEQLNKAIAEYIHITYKPLSNSEIRPYVKNSIRQAADILGIEYNDILKNNYSIYTYMDYNTQQIIADKIYSQEYYKPNSQGIMPDGMALLCDNETSGILGYCSTSPYLVYDIVRQPGSAIKPLSVYVPALEHNIISPATPILDELTTFDDYTPKNYGDKYYGWVSAREALAKSLNVPAVKILSYVGNDRALDYLNKLGFDTVNEDSSLALALGGTKNGTTLIEMAAAYKTLANNGYYKDLSFIREIKDSNGTIIYKHDDKSIKVINDDNAYLITDMLKSVVSNGTASKLNTLGYEIAAKTGTVSSSDSNYNSDAWSISYTNKNTLAVWLGNISNKKESLLDKSITGGAYPTMMARDIYNDFYNDYKPEGFVRPDTIVTIELDKISLEKDHSLMLAGDLTPEEYRFEEIFSINNVPKEFTKYYNIPIIEDLDIYLDGRNPVITFYASSHVNYYIEREFLYNVELVEQISEKQGKIMIVDDDAPRNKLIKYTITPKIIINEKEIYGTPKSINIFTRKNRKTLNEDMDNYNIDW